MTWASPKIRETQHIIFPAHFSLEKLHLAGTREYHIIQNKSEGERKLVDVLAHLWYIEKQNKEEIVLNCGPSWL